MRAVCVLAVEQTVLELSFSWWAQARCCCLSSVFIVVLKHVAGRSQVQCWWGNLVDEWEFSRSDVSDSGFSFDPFVFSGSAPGSVPREGKDKKRRRTKDLVQALSSALVNVMPTFGGGGTKMDPRLGGTYGKGSERGRIVEVHGSSFRFCKFQTNTSGVGVRKNHIGSVFSAFKGSLAHAIRKKLSDKNLRVDDVTLKSFCRWAVGFNGSACFGAAEASKEYQEAIVGGGVVVPIVAVGKNDKAHKPLGRYLHKLVKRVVKVDYDALVGSAVVIAPPSPALSDLTKSEPSVNGGGAMVVVGANELRAQNASDDNSVSESGVIAELRG